MKIAVLLFNFPVLSETFIDNQVTGLINRGHDVHIFCETFLTNQIEHEDVVKYNLKRQMTCYGKPETRFPRNKIRRVIKAGHLLYMNRQRNIYSLLKTLNFFKYGKDAIALRIFHVVLAFLENNIGQYDIAHCHFGPNGDLAAMLKDLGAFKGKVVTTFHGEAGYTREKKYRSEKAYKNKGYNVLFSIGDLFLPMSEKEKENLINLGCDPRKIVVHRMGIDTKRFQFTHFKPTNGKNIQLLSVGRLVEKKGFEYGIRFVAKIVNKYPKIEYKIAGDGPLRNQLQTVINNLGLEEKVKILGSKTQEEIVELIKGANFLLAPSVTSRDGDTEGIPVVLMEAMACGLPVLSTQHTGIPELIQDGKSGFLVPEREINALVEKLERLLEDSDLCVEMARAGRDRIEKYHDIDKLNDRLAKLFQALLDGKNIMDL